MRRVAVACALGLAVTAVPAAAHSHHVAYIRGRVVDGTGAGVRGATVSFELHPNRELYNQHDCPVRPWEIQCRVHKVAGKTDANGRYRLPVRLSSFLATKREHKLIVTDRPTPGATLPARTSITMYFPGTSVDVLDLPVWRARPTISPATVPGMRTLHVDPMPDRYGRPYTTGPVVDLLQGTRTAWQFTDVVEDRMVDGRLVEAGTTAIRARDAKVLGRQFPVYESPAYAISGAAAKPLSRGAACATYGRDDVVLPLSKCKFTDGALATPVDAQYQRAGGKACDVASQCDHPRWLRIDLGAPSLVGAVAVRGCPAKTAEVSAEGTVFAPFTATDRDGLLVGVPAPARYVRVDLKHCVYKATEVSVFAPA
jgi:hypothetical protein